MQSGTQSGVKIIVNEITYMKFKTNPKMDMQYGNLEYHINEVLGKNHFSRYNKQLSYLAKFTKLINGEKNVFHNWVKSELNYNHSNEDITIHNTLIQKLDEEQLEGSGFVFQYMEEAVLEIYKVNDIKASSYIERFILAY